MKKDLQTYCKKGGFDDTKFIRRVREELAILYAFIARAYRNYFYSSHHCHDFGFGYRSVHHTEAKIG